MSIRQKLILLMAVMVTAIIGFLAYYFPTHEIESLESGMMTKAESYGAILSTQLRSAVAFDDRETAREVLTSLSSDPDVVSVHLFAANGTVLYENGLRSDWHQRARLGVAEAKTFPLAERIATVAPVVSLEGPRGTLVLELSTEPLRVRANQVRATAFGIGALALLFGVVAASLIARSIARRLSAIAEVASSVAAGSRDARADDAGRDEIGTLAASFNAMTTQLQAEETALATVNRELEGRVEDRTKQLAGKNREVQLLLDSVAQGLLKMSPLGVLTEERSAAATQLLGAYRPDQPFGEALAALDPGAGIWFELGWAEVTADNLPFALCMEQLPKCFEAQDRSFRIDYQPTWNNDRLAEVLIVITDVTAEIARERAETAERDLVRLLERMATDRRGLYEFLGEADALVLRIRESSSPLRELHTLKGTSAVFGLTSIAELCHRLEEKLSTHQALGERDLTDLESTWSALKHKVRFLIDRDDDVVELRVEDLQSIRRALESGGSLAQLQAIVDSWDLEPVKSRFDRLAEQARQLAERLGKPAVTVEVDADGLRLDPAVWRSFFGALVHAIRNAVDHGIETAEERVAAGKSPQGNLRLNARLQNGDFALDLSDDGRGIDWDSIRERATALGLPSQTKEQLMLALFHEGLSTKSEVTEISGRGVGLSAVLDECGRLGGTMEVRSEPGRGTRLCFRWPRRVLALRAQPSPPLAA